MKIVPMQVELIHHVGFDLTVVNAARVSFHKESDWEEIPNSFEQLPDYDLSDKDKKLINYLAKHNHHSPFNHSFLTFRVKAPIFVARQLVKHKFMPWNEVSRRYVEDEPEFYFPENWREYAENKKQGSSDVFVSSEHHPELWSKELTIKALQTYQYLLEINTCPEQARMILPQNTMTEWWWSGTLGAFLDMLKLRLDTHTQYESRVVAFKIYDVIKELFPVSCSAYLGEINIDSRPSK